MMPNGLLGEIQCSFNSLELYGGRTVKFVGALGAAKQVNIIIKYTSFASFIIIDLW